MKYRPEVDGLRTVAVVPVILFHAGLTSVSGGYVGVDVFFVISGFLITTIIWNEVREGRFSIGRFYKRRARRILPALFLVMALTYGAALALMTPADLKYFGQSALSVLGFVSNIFFWREANYFDTASELKPLLHTWSLAVEEQYYIFFPLLGWLIFNRGVWLSLSILVLISLGSFVICYWGGYNSPTAAFYLLPTRAWELLAGSLLAVAVAGRSVGFGLPKYASEALSLLGLALILYSIVAFSPTTRWPGTATVVPVLGSVLIIGFAAKGTVTHWLLSLKVMVGIGLVSYSAYLWHQPLFAFARYVHIDGHPPLALMLGLAVAVGPLSYLTWRYVEGPFRDKATMPLPRLTISLSAAAAALAVVALAAHLTGGMPGRGVGVTALAYDSDNKALRQATWGPLRTLSGDRGYIVDSNPYDRELWFDLTDPRPKMLIVGNSFSKDLYNDLSQSQTAKAHFQLARFGVDLRRAIVPASGFLGSPNFEAADVVVMSTLYTGRDVAAVPKLIDAIEAAGKRAVVVLNPFEYRLVYDRTPSDVVLMQAHRDGVDLETGAQEITDQINRDAYAAMVLDQWRRPQVQGFNDSLRTMAAAADVTLLDRMDYRCDRDRQICHVIGSDLAKYLPDHSHHTLAGSAFYGPRIDATGWLAPLLPGGS